MVYRKRHLAKAVSYRLFGSCWSMAIAYAFTRDLSISVGVFLADSVAKIGLYYLHERIWYRIKWGVAPEVPDPLLDRRAEHRDRRMGTAG